MPAREHSIKPAMNAVPRAKFDSVVIWILPGVLSAHISPLIVSALLAYRVRVTYPVPYLWHPGYHIAMKPESVRTTVDIPAPLYRKLKKQAAAQGRSVRELIVAGVKITLLEGKRPRAKKVRFPLIVSTGPKVDLTNEQIYEHVEFP